MSSDKTDAFDQVHGLSISDPDQFWGNAAEEIYWYTNCLLYTSDAADE